MTMRERDASRHILQHALGLDDDGRDESYRNHYVAGEGHHSWDLLMEHVAAGRMVRHDPREIFGGMYCFTVTEAGRAHVRPNSPALPKLTRSQRRYQRYLEADTGLKFGEWLREQAKEVAHG